LIWQLKQYGFGNDAPGPFPPHVMIGAWLTALSGMLNACLLVHVHVSARTGKASRSNGAHPAWFVVLAWLVPGLGHLAQGRRLRGALVFLLLVGLFAWGTWLAAGSNLSRERHFYYWSGQFLVGLPALVTELVSGRPPLTRELAWGDVGLLYACMAGLLNVLAMLDVYAVAERRWLAPSTAPASEPAVESA
jgi:bacteriorhodopsin